MVKYFIANKFKKINLSMILAVFLTAVFVGPHSFAQTEGLLSPEEDFWLESRNNTIVVYPEQNNPPFSYQSASGNIQGLSIDYLELVAEKIGAKIQYLTPRSRSQIFAEIKEGKGDVTFFTPDKEKEPFLIFTESFSVVPVVIVVRKDFDKRGSLTLNDFNGKKVAMVDDSSIETYVNLNYPRVVREGVSDNEVALQQVVLGEVDAVVMDVASLSFYLSKQVLSSVKIAGSTGLDYKPAFALQKDKTILQSILEKGLTQISASERELLSEKWVNLPGEYQKENSLPAVIQNNLSTVMLYILFALGIYSILSVLFFQKRTFSGLGYFKKQQDLNELREEMKELEGANDMIAKELKDIKEEEDRIQEKIESLRK